MGESRERPSNETIRSAVANLSKNTPGVIFIAHAISYHPQDNEKEYAIPLAPPYMAGDGNKEKGKNKADPAFHPDQKFWTDKNNKTEIQKKLREAQRLGLKRIETDCSNAPCVKENKQEGCLYKIPELIRGFSEVPVAIEGPELGESTNRKDQKSKKKHNQKDKDQNQANLPSGAIDLNNVELQMFSHRNEGHPPVVIICKTSSGPDALDAAAEDAKGNRKAYNDWTWKKE